MKSNSQAGSAHVIIIAVIAVVLVGVIGVLFYQNFINKPASESATSAKQTTSPSPALSPNVVASLKSYCSPIEKICFDYPTNWSVKVDSADPENDGIAERIAISDDKGQQWLRLDTGLGGVGGACGNDDGSYVKIIKTHTTKVQNGEAYAAGWLAYHGTDKNWTIEMGLNSSKTVQAIGKYDPCDLGLGIVAGKNAPPAGVTTGTGPLSFRLYDGKSASTTYATEAAATAALDADEATKAYGILQSAHY